jgi:pimeloyl-ACP methyl ester carboxylesterase
MGGAGHRLDHDDVGSGDPPLVFVHGWCCTRAFFEPQVEHFRERHRVVTVDLTPGRDVTEAADDVAALCAELGLEQPAVLGHSLGGMIAIELAARHPSLPRAIVGLDPGPITATEEARRAFTALAEQMLGPDGERVRRDYVEKTAEGTIDPERRRFVVETMCRVPLERAAAELRGVVAWNGVGALALCHAPLLVVRALAAGGSNDPARLLAIKPDTVVGVTVGAGHFNHLDVPEQVNPMLERFLGLVAEHA